MTGSQKNRPKFFSNFPSTLAEVSWLAATVIIPVTADLLLFQKFTAPKVALTQILGILSALALALHALDTAIGRGYHLSKKVGAASWASGMAILLVAVSFISWRFALDTTRVGDSVDVSSLGPGHIACQVAIFLSLAVFLRTSAQLERLAMCALAAGFPIAMLALMQTYGFQSPGYAVIEGMTITSFIGGPIFLAGYLLMLIPLAVWNLQREHERSGGKLTSRVAFAALMLLVLTGAFLACGKRGPTVGLMTMICSALVLLAVQQRRFRLLTAAVAVAVSVAIALTGLALMQRAGIPVKRVPFLDRLAMIVPVGGETGDSYRANLWALLPGLMLDPQPLALPSGADDPQHAMRPWIGFGPDNVQAVLPSKYIFLQAWPSDVLEVSCHSHFWDLVLSLGAAGVVVFFALFFAVWYQGSVKIGARPPPPSVAIVLAFGIAVAGGTVAALVFHSGYFGLGMQAGFLAGLLALGLWTKSSEKTPAPAMLKSTLLLLAMLSALAGHWIDLGFIFPTAENSLMFWIFAGAIVGWRSEHGRSNKNGEQDSRQHQIVGAAVGAALLITLIHARVNLGAVMSGQAGLGELLGAAPATALLAILGLVSCWAACWLFQLPSDRSGHFLSFDPACRLMIAAAVVYLAGVFCLARLMVWYPPRPEQPWLADTWALHFPLLIIAGVVLVAVVMAAHGGHQPWVAGVSGLLVALVCVSIAWGGPLSHLRSAVSAGIICSLPHAESWLERSIALRPWQIRKYETLAELLAEESFRENITAEDRRRLLARAERILLQGIAISNFNLLSAKLGNLYLRRALQTEDSGKVKDLADSARQYLRSAVCFAPQNEPAWVDAALVEQEFFPEERKVNSMLRMAHAITLTPPTEANVVMRNWGYYYVVKALSADTEKLRRHYAAHALMYLRLHLHQTSLASEKLGGNSGDSDSRKEIILSRIDALIHMGSAHRILGQKDESAAAFDEAQKLLRDMGGNAQGSPEPIEGVEPQHYRITF